MRFLKHFPQLSWDRDPASRPWEVKTTMTENPRYHFREESRSYKRLWYVDGKVTTTDIRRIPQLPWTPQVIGFIKLNDSSPINNLNPCRSHQHGTTRNLSQANWRKAQPQPCSSIEDSWAQVRCSILNWSHTKTQKSGTTSKVMKIPISERHIMSIKQEDNKRAMLNHRSTIAIPKKPPEERKISSAVSRRKQRVLARMEMQLSNSNPKRHVRRIKGEASIWCAKRKHYLLRWQKPPTLMIAFERLQVHNHERTDDDRPSPLDCIPQPMNPVIVTP